MVAGKILKAKEDLKCCKQSVMGRSGERLGEPSARTDMGRDLAHGVSEREEP